MEASYQEQTLAGATGIELVIALYDGAIRQLHRAAQCCDEDDVRGRRIAVKKAVDIVMYLQGTAAAGHWWCAGRIAGGVLYRHVHDDS